MGLLHDNLEDTPDEVGFTLVEILIVIVILGILAGVVVFAVGNLTGDATKNSCVTEASTFKAAFTAYTAHNQGKVPGEGKPGGADAQAVIDELVSTPAPVWALSNNGGPYLQRQPLTFAVSGSATGTWTISDLSKGDTDTSHC